MRSEKNISMDILDILPLHVNSKYTWFGFVKQNSFRPGSTLKYLHNYLYNFMHKTSLPTIIINRLTITGKAVG